MYGYYIAERNTLSEYNQKRNYVTQQTGGSLLGAMALYGTAKTLLGKASDYYSGQKATMFKNIVGKQLTSNPNWRQSYAGEKHIVLPTEHGLTMANYCGPGTNLTERLKNNDPGVDGPNGVDEACKAHDIALSKATNKTQARKADKALISAVNKSKANGIIKKAIKGIIRAKNVAEDFGVLDSGLPEEQIPQDRTINQKKGKIPELPAQRLKQKIIKKEKKLKVNIPKIQDSIQKLRSKGKGKSHCGGCNKCKKCKIRKILRKIK